MFDQKSSSSPSGTAQQIQNLKEQLLLPQSQKGILKESTKTIKVNPGQLFFTNVVAGQHYQQQLTLENTLSVPVQLTLKCSSEDRLTINPTRLNLAPRETSKPIQVQLRLRNQSASKTMKETLFIKSDFFDQKVPVVIQTGGVAHSVRLQNSEQVNFSDNMLSSQESKQRNSLSMDPSCQIIEENQETASEDAFTEPDYEQVAVSLKERLAQAQIETEQVKQMLKNAHVELSTTQKATNEQLLGQIRGIMNEREPNLDELLTLALKNERASQERKDQKVLEILNVKDAQLSDVQSQLDQEKLLRTTLNDQFRESEDRICAFRMKTERLEQELSMTLQRGPEDTKVEELEGQLATFRQTLQSKDQKEAFFEEAYSRQKAEIEEYRNKFENMQQQLKQQQELNTKLEQEMSRAYEALEQVTGDSQSQSVLSDHNQNQNEVSLIGANAQQLFGTSQNSTWLAERLTRRCEEIVFVFEQLHSQYALLEGKLQSNTESQDIAIQSNLMAGDIDDMQEHFNKVSKRAMDQQTENDGLKVQLNQAKQECDKLKTAGSFAQEYDELYSYTNQKSSLGGGPRHANQTAEKPEAASRNYINIDMTGGKVFDQPGTVSQETFNALNSRMQDMKQREDALLQQLSVMKQKLYHRSTQEDLKVYQFPPQQSTASVDQYLQEPSLEEQQTSHNQSTNLLQLRVGELESVIYRQHEELVKFEEVNVDLDRQLNEQRTNEQNKNDLLELRGRNLEEMNKKYEEMQREVQHSSTLASNELFSSGVMKQTSAKRFLSQQQLEMQNLELRHKLQEAHTAIEQTGKESAMIKENLVKAQNDAVHLRNSTNLKLAGLSEDRGGALAVLVQEQRSRIQTLEQTQHQNLDMPGCLQSTELFTLREEYSSKLEQMAEQHNSALQTATSKWLGTKQRADNLEIQLKFMEQKEVKIFGQLEEIKGVLSQQADNHDSTLLETQKVLESRNQLVSELEREVKQKERVLSERQEQMSVLLSAMEGYQHDSDQETKVGELKTKVSNMAAELCSLKAVQAQIERKASESMHREKALQGQASKLEQEKSDIQKVYQELTAKQKTFMSQNEFLERQRTEQSNQIQRLHREQNDNKYKYERLTFQLKVKEDTIAQLKNQIRKGELHFRQQIDQIKEDVLNTQRYKGHDNDTGYQNQTTLKITLQQLHVCLVDYMERACKQPFQENEGQDQAEIASRHIVYEMEKALSVAAMTMQKLEQDLSKEKFKSAQLDNNWEATKLNGILISRQEKLINQIQTQNQISVRRDTQTALHAKAQNDGTQKVIRELEMKIENYQKQLQESDEEIEELKVKSNRALLERDDLQSQVQRFQQELKSRQGGMERRAEISFDERFRAKNETIKTYFDSQITRILMGQDTDTDKALELGREVCAMQLLVDKLQRLVSAEQAEKESLNLTVKFYKEQLTSSDQQAKDMKVKLAQASQKLNSNSQIARLELEHQKQDNLQLEKRLIKEREAGEAKAQEMMNVNQLQVDQFTEQLKNVDLSQNIDNNFESKEQMNKKVQQLQEHQMDLRSAHIQELEELKVQCDCEVAEAKRLQSLQRDIFEKQFLPGTAPGEILDQNHNLKETVEQLQVTRHNDFKEGSKLRQQLQGQMQLIDDQKVEIDSLKSSLQELKCHLHSGKFNDIDQSSDISASKKSLQSTNKKPVFAEDQFSFNPPSIVKALVESKTAEMSLKTKLKKVLQNEQNLKNKLAQNFEMYLANEFNQKCENKQEQLIIVENLLTEIQLQNESLKGWLRGEHRVHMEKFDDAELGEVTNGDYDTLVQTVVSLTHQLALQQTNSTQQNIFAEDDEDDLQPASPDKIIEAQRIVIRALAPQKQDKIRYAPEREIDRKIWYLELLESQVSDTEKQIGNLQEFIKRLQIGISGSLHSAAEVKAASMDLTQHTLAAAHEVKTLRHVTGLIKHDVLSQQQSRPKKPFNPFIDAEHQTLSTGRSEYKHLAPSDLQQTARSNMEKLAHENESVTNQLSLTSKIKQSLESELVHSKLQHAQELQGLVGKFSKAEKVLSEKETGMLLVKSELEKALQEKQEQQQQIEQLEKSLSEAQKSVSETKEGQGKAKNTAKHLSKLQADLLEWRKQSESNLRLKQQQIDELKAEKERALLEKEKKVAENTMLRRNQKTFLNGQQLQDLHEQNEQLEEKLKQVETEREKEIGFWVQERSQMRDKIDHLECTGGQGILGKVYNKGGPVPNEEGTDHEVNKKAMDKKLRQVESELKKKDKELVALQNQFVNQKLNEVNLEKALRSEKETALEIENDLKTEHIKMREIEVERDLIRAEHQKFASENDQEAEQVAFELQNLRQAFSKVKIDRDNLAHQMEEYEIKESEWRITLEKFGSEMANLEKSISQKESEATTALNTLETKNTALIKDLRFLRTENEKLQQKIKELHQQLMSQDGDIAQANQSSDNQQNQIDELKRKFVQQVQKTSSKEQQNCVLKAELQAKEVESYQAVKNLQKLVATAKTDQVSAQHLMSQQVQWLKEKLTNEKKATSKEVDSYLSITAKDAQNKQLKKEIALNKAEIAKLKAKNTSLKSLQEQKPVKPVPTATYSGRPSSRQKLIDPQPAQQTQDQQLIEKLQKVDGLNKMLAESKNLNALEAQIAELQAAAVINDNQMFILHQKVEEKEDKLTEMKEEVDDVIKSQKTDQKNFKINQNQAEKSLKEQLKSSNIDLANLKRDWFSPQQVQEIYDQQAELQSQIKQQQIDLQRKTKIVATLKQQKECFEKEQEELLSEIEGVKDDRQKSSKAVKEAQKLERHVRDLRGQLEWAQQTERRLKDEISALNDKLKGCKIDIQRKEVINKDLKEKVEVHQKDVGSVNKLKAEIEGERERTKKYKLDCEIKENQVRTLKQRVEQNSEELKCLNDATYKQQAQDSSDQSNVKMYKQRAKKYETYLKKSLGALKTIGKQLSVMQADQVTDKSHNHLSPMYNQNEMMMVSELGKERDENAQHYYKDSVQILGVSMNELEEFVNPGGSMLGTKPQSANKLLSSGVSSTIGRADFEAKLDRLASLPDSISSKHHHHSSVDNEIDEIGEQCLRIISEIHSQGHE